MTFNDTFKEIVTTCADIRYGINEDLKKRLGNLHKAFAILYGKEKSWYSNLTKAHYSRMDDSPKHEVISDKIGELFSTLEYMGSEDLINGYLRRNYGLVIQRVEEQQKIIRLSRPDMEELKKLGLDINLDMDDRELYIDLLSKAEDTIKEIDEQSSMITGDYFESLTEKYPESGMSKSTFTRAVATKALELKDINKAEAKKEKIQSQNEIENELLDLIVE